MNSRLSLLLVLSSAICVSCSRSTPSSEKARDNATNSPAATSTAPATSPGAAAPPTSSNDGATVAAKPSIDACALLTSKEIESVQGEALKETKLSGQSTGGFAVSQCFFTLPTFSNSISLSVALKRAGGSSRDPKEFWRETFHEGKSKERRKEKELERKRGEEEEESAPPQKIKGIGDDAYWTGSRVGGALYVLKGESYFRISIGGAKDQATRIKRSRLLAEKVLTRL